MTLDDDTRARVGTTWPAWARPFLAALAIRGTPTKAAQLCGVISRQNAYVLRNRDPEFAAAWDAALEEFRDTLEDTARARALDGWMEPVYQGGGLVGVKWCFSEQLLIRLLESAGRFVRRHEHSGPGGGKIPLEGRLVIRRRARRTPSTE